MINNWFSEVKSTSTDLLFRFLLWLLLLLLLLLSYCIVLLRQMPRERRYYLWKRKYCNVKRIKRFDVLNIYIFCLLLGMTTVLSIYFYS